MISDDDLLPVAHHEAHALPSPELVRKAKRAADLARAATSERTRQAYAYEFEQFARWCEHHNAPALPTTAAVLATYLADMHHQGRAVASLAVARAAVLFINKEAGHAIDSKAEALRKVMAGARRTRRADPKRVRPFLISDFLELAPHMGNRLEDVRDRAMLALGLARALRGPSELMTLDLDRLGSPEARGFIELGARGITVHLVRSKTSQEVTKSYFIERGPAVEAVEAWIRRAGIRAGSPLWRTVEGENPEAGRMSARTWDRIIKRRVAELYRLRGLTIPEARQAARAYSTHSLRAGTITSLADAGATIAEIRDVTGHAEGSAAILLAYMRRYGAGVKQIKKLGL
jgi:site-specific recombinase XerD